MILKDYTCQECGHTQEFFVDPSNIPEFKGCRLCGGKAKKILTMSMTAPVDCSWIGTVRTVVDKSPDKPHCQEFLRHPTRGNYKKWMAGENLRPLEIGESPMPKVDRKARRKDTRKKMLEMYRARNEVSI